jgi:hypothetical protein
MQTAHFFGEKHQNTNKNTEKDNTDLHFYKSFNNWINEG